MEPRPDDGDDVRRGPDGEPDPQAAMEPRPDDGDDRTGRLSARTQSGSPQWSPALTTGTTQAATRNGRSGCPRAAMEPRSDDGDDHIAAHPGVIEALAAAMEPRPDDGDDNQTALTGGTAATRPQWSPALTTGTT